MENRESSMAGDLDGVTVISLEQAVAAPYASSRLADAGARVIKIERQEGDFARRYDRLVKGGSAYFIWINRGKESIVLDVKRDDDALLLHRMIGSADVFIQNLRPGAAQRLGFGSAELRDRYPRLITCDVSGFGDGGELRDKKAYDLLVQAESGLCSITGAPESPGRVGVSVCDIAAGMYAHAAILQALYARENTGLGRTIKVSLFDGMADWMTVPLLQSQYGGQEPKRSGIHHATIAPYGAYECSGGKQLVLSIQNNGEWQRFCSEVLKSDIFSDDPRFRDNTARVGNRAQLDNIINKAFQTLQIGELIARLDDAQIAYGMINDVRGLQDHPALRRMTVGTPNGPVDLVAPPAKVGGIEPACGAVPALGEHSEAIRREFES